MKKKVVPKKTIKDAEGNWEVTDEKKSILVEANSDGEQSLSDWTCLDTFLGSNNKLINFKKYCCFFFKYYLCQR